ncbi:MAG: hypothetical protein SPD90_00430 [Intestinibacter sp.]|uniref:hypothetical protein n=1 Tax=Intestinibacter sp. TaxID=1965304 RepID=UPI002A7EC60C|nr:hypothetical protein [Intestinibacter sp.]MDY4573502.1 hypothetical protein [Intestinibacter sp.]
MKKLDEISINAKQLYEDLRDLEESTKKENLKDIDFDYFRGLAKQNAFKDHILKDESEYIQKNYLYLMSSLLMFNNKEDIKNSQILYISRLIEGFCNKNLDIENIYSHTMIMSGVQISDCIEIIKDYKDVFVVDSLICANIKGRANDEVLEYLSEIYSIMGIKSDKFKDLMNLCNVILENDSSKILEIEMRDIGRYRHHINKMFKEKVFYDLEDIDENEQGDIILLNYSLDMKLRNIKSKLKILYADSEKHFYCDVYNDNAENIVAYNDKFNIDMSYHFKTKSVDNMGLSEGYINLDKYMLKKISFINCEFNGIIGIKSTNKDINFVNCTIENIKENYIYYKDEKNFIQHKIIVPINLKNASFMKCDIKNCKILDRRDIKEDDYSMMIFEKCIFKKVNFISCEMGVGYHRTDIPILKLYDSKMEECTFIDNICLLRYKIINMKDSEINKALFKKCILLRAIYDYSLIKANNSKITNSKFEDCYGESEQDWYGEKKVTGCIFDLENRSKEENNKFINCKFREIVKS